MKRGACSISCEASLVVHAGSKRKDARPFYIGELYESRVVEEQDMMVEWLKCEEDLVNTMAAPTSG